MITFLEGLPRSGKSYSALKDYIVPALKKGRAVFAYIEGLNHEKIAHIAGISEERCHELLHQITREQMPEVYKHVQNDALVILDEAQNFWPAGRSALPVEITEFITEHGHRGLDIVLMGQCIKDVHALWKNRVESKIYFLKKTAVGKPDAYSATFYSVIPYKDGVKFQKIQSIGYTYDSTYFGAYKSHTDDTTNKETHVDQRAVIWNHPLFRKWLPIAGVVFLGCCVYLYNWFSGGFEKSINKSTAKPTVQADVKVGDVVTLPGTPQAAPAQAVSEPEDVIDDLQKRGRVRLLGFVRLGNKTRGFLEWRDSANNLIQTLSIDDLNSLGYTFMINQFATVATITRGAKTITALAWNIDPAIGRPSETQTQKISGRDPLVMAESTTH